MSVPLEKADLKVGENSVTFRFNKSDSHSMGYRIVKLNVLDASGKKLIAEEGFRESLPSSWTPPSNASADIEAGKQLWMNRNLVSSYLPGAVPIKAKCASCHTTTGFDLKYFGFSNLSIVERSKFHGMTQKEGEQVASYIRSLPVKAVGRPWNPPYQPGPGTSSKPNSEWAAGAGIDHVLDEDWDTIKHIFPDGIKRSAIVEGDTNNIKRFSAHDTPIALQLPDWNHWLPEIHPLDAFGEEWTAKWQDLNHFNKISEQLKGKSAAEIKNWYATSSTNNGGTRFPTGYFAFRDWPDTLKDIADAASQDSGEDANGRFKDPLVAQKIYAMRVFRLVKIFELQEEFQLTGMGPEVRGAWWIGLDEKQTLPRAWIGIDRVVFDTSPFLSALPSPVTGSNSGNNSFNYDYLSNSWYTLQLLLNGGQRGAGSHRAVDFGYAHGFMSGMNASTGYNMNGHAVMWELRGMDEADNGNLPGPHGWSFRRTGLSALNIAPLSEGEKHPFWFGRATPESKAVLSVLQQVNAEKMASWLPEQYVTRDGAPFNPSEDGGNWEDKNFKLEGNYDPETHHRSAALKTWKFLRLAKAEKILHPALINARLNFGLAMWPGLNSSGVPTNPWLSVRETVGAAPAAPTASVTGEARRKRTGQSDLVRKVVTVQWKSAPGFKTYNVKRSDNPNGPFLTVAFFRDSGSFKDETPLPGRTYYYRMSGNTDASESSDSASATVVVSP
jgi:LSD1 subclass zinc finger protein